MPKEIHQPKIETKALSSPNARYGFSGHHYGYPDVTPHYPPGLSQNTNTFLENPMANCDGLLDDSLFMRPRNSANEEQARVHGRKSHDRVEHMVRAPDVDGNAWIEEQKRLLLPTNPPTNEQLDVSAQAWLLGSEDKMVKDVKTMLLQSEHLALLPPGTKYWQQSSESQRTEIAPAMSASRHAPIGSERIPALNDSRTANTVKPTINGTSCLSSAIDPATSVNNDKEIRNRAAIDLMGPVMARLSSYRAGEDPGPLQRYSQPPAWCIDHSEAGRRSFFNDNWGDVPKRVGRDPRYQQTMHEGRSTYFEDPTPNYRREREGLSGYKPTPGWGMNRK